MGANEWKRCSCGRAYDDAAWRALPFVGEWDDGVEVFELRQCFDCRSTIAIVVRPSGTSAPAWPWSAA